VLERELSELDRQTDDLGLLESRQEELERQQARMERHRRVLRLAMKGLEVAEDRLQRSFLPQLNAEFNRMASHITGSARRRFDLNDLAHVQVIGEQTRGIDPLSFGTKEQIYLALRLALARVAARAGEPLPLLLDEPFASADSRRLRAAMELLASWADETQVILFTCHDHIVRAAQEAASGEAVLREL